ncbi:LAFE_0G18404g1_1 [Lachancea fermentati]|uniref:LAFE_0G18404g1_1 n=1 Tax=Lachancea fermentati TaxID=4955 RepID=A0A1G4MJ77_LACFM|nr:LAFE_0G18404g1_1 [Lachancea fermentati]
MGLDEALTSGSTSTSTNSLFSLNHRNSYSSIIDQYYEEQDSPVESFHETTALTINYPRRQRGLSISSNSSEKLVVILVGLPAGGKSTISNHLIQFLSHNTSTQHMRCKVFNAGQVRRKLSCRGRPMALANNSSEDLFNPKNTQKKEKYAKITLKELFSELSSDLCDVAIFDATNSTERRRSFLFHEMRVFNSDISHNFHITPLVLQVSSVDHAFVRYNIHNKTFNQDYFDKPYEFAVRDFARRLSHYYSQFVPFTKLEFDRHVAEGKFIEEDRGLFWFSIVNAGLSNSSQLNASHFPEQSSPMIEELVRVIESFVDSYAEVYGFKYIEKAKSFINGESTERDQGRAGQSSDVPYLATLNRIVDDEYFRELNWTSSN